MKRKLLLVMLALGTVAGYASAAFRHHRYHHYDSHRAFEEHVADICVAAVQRQAADRASGHSR